MRVFSLIAVSVILICAAVAVQAEDTIGQKIGRKVNQAVSQVQQSFEDARNAVNRLSVEGRVYARLHWDKALQDASVSVDVTNDGVATLHGSVPNDAAKTKAEQLTNDTVGIQRVVNELQIVAAAAK
jgi:osmotically-inducible protein OsmY